MFLPHSFDTPESQPWEWLPAYTSSALKVGQLLNLTEGKLASVSAASKTTPTFVCMCEKTVAQDELVPVVRIHKGIEFETTLSAAAADAKVGSKLEVSAGGLQVDLTAAGTFELTYVDDTAKDAMVRGRFV